MENKLVGKIAIWAFIIGTVIALVVGLYQAYTIQTNGAASAFMTTNSGALVAWLLAIIGAIVGILAFLGKGTITKEEVPAFLTASIALLVMYGVFQGLQSMIGYWLGPLFAGVSLTLSIFIAPAAGILAIKAIYDIGKDV
jgi:hypothetical protein